MNATSNTTSDMDTNNNPWVESGAMVYVAITVATMSAVIMCCTWFITHNTALQRWWHGKAQYGGLDDGEEEEEIELIEEKNDTIQESSEKSYTDSQPEDTSAFTLEDGGSSDSGGSDHLPSEEHADAV